MLSHVSPLLQAGCHIWRAPLPFDHSKLMVVDNTWCLFGSPNWDTRSLRLNFEMAIEAYDPILANQLSDIINQGGGTPLTIEELQSRSFQGIISLHTDDTSDGFYGFARGATLTKNLIEPALKAAEKFLPRDARPIIDGFPARNGVIYHAYDGILTAPPKVRPRPFEIILETPVAPPEYLKELAFVAALQTILLEYNKFIAYAPNL